MLKITLYEVIRNYNSKSDRRSNAMKLGVSNYTTIEDIKNLGY